MGEIQTGPDLRGRQLEPRGEQFLDAGCADLVNFVRDPDDGERIIDAQAEVEALQHLPVVDIDRPGGDVQTGQDLVNDPGKLGVEVERNVVDVDDIDVTLGELTIAPLLRALASPDPLHLVAPEREDQVVEVRGNVPGERHGQVEVQAEPGIAAVGSLGLEPAQRVDLLGRLALGQQNLKGLDGRGLDRAEAVALEPLADLVEPALLDQPDLRQPFGEPADLRGADELLVAHRELLSSRGAALPARYAARTVSRA